MFEYMPERMWDRISGFFLPDCMSETLRNHVRIACQGGDHLEKTLSVFDISQKSGFPVSAFRSWQSSGRRWPRWRSDVVGSVGRGTICGELEEWQFWFAPKDSCGTLKARKVFTSSHFQLTWTSFWRRGVGLLWKTQSFPYTWLLQRCTDAQMGIGMGCIGPNLDALRIG